MSWCGGCNHGLYVNQRYSNAWKTRTVMKALDLMKERIRYLPALPVAVKAQVLVGLLTEENPSRRAPIVMATSFLNGS